MSTDKQNYTKDYSLLRKFDLEAAKNGEHVLVGYGNKFDDCVYITHHIEPIEEYVFNVKDHGFVILGASGSCTHAFTLDSAKMKPLAWVEGKPVYKGDVLWYNEFGFSIEVTGNNDYDPNNGLKGKVKEVTKKNPCCHVGGELTWAPFYEWSWNKPKVKREGWINVYKKHQTGSKIYVTKEEAYEGCEKCFSAPADDYITTVRIEWEE